MSRGALNPKQMKLFYSAQELKGQITASGDRWDGETLPKMWDRKLEESRVAESPYRRPTHGAGVYQSIANKGFQQEEPLKMGHHKDAALVTDGHHRIAAAAAIEEKTGKPHWINVEHSNMKDMGYLDNTGWSSYMSRNGKQRTSQLRSEEKWDPTTNYEPNPEAHSLADDIMGGYFHTRDKWSSGS